MATAKQVAYVLHLLSKAGYSTRFMSSEYKRLGATMRERSGTVESWLLRKNNAEMSELIGELEKLLADAASGGAL